MTKLYKTYHCKQRNKDNITIESLDAAFIAGDLVVGVEDNEVSEDPSQVALSRADALSLAWDIIEHFGEGTRPKPVIKVGDYVKSSTGLVGRVKSIDENENIFGDKRLYADTLMGRHLWSVDYVSPATEQEFIDHHQQRIAEITNGQD